MGGCAYTVLESCWSSISHANIQGQCLLRGLSTTAHSTMQFLTLVSVVATKSPFVLCPSVCLCARPAFTTSTCCAVLLCTWERRHRDILTGPIPQLLLSVHRLPLAPVSGSWIRPSSRWSVEWQVDTAFIGQPGLTNHRPVSSQMPSGAPGARNPPPPSPRIFGVATLRFHNDYLTLPSTRRQADHISNA